VDWESEAEMQRLLDMLPNVQSSSMGMDGGNALGFDLDLESEWDMERSHSSSLMGTSIGVF